MIYLHLVEHVVDDQRPAAVVGIPGLQNGVKRNRVELVGNCGKQRKDACFGGGARSALGGRAPPASPGLRCRLGRRRGRTGPPPAPFLRAAPPAPGGGHEPSLANWLPAGRMRGGFGSSYSPGLVVVVGRSKQTSDELAEWLLRGRHHTDGDRDGRTCGSGARDDASHGPGRSFMVAVCYQRI
jgi:hypothetical protein